MSWKVTFQNVGKRFGENQILQGLDFIISPGRVVSLIGPTGGGKTSILKLAADLDSPSNGKVAFEGFPSSRSPSISMVFQSPSLWPNMTVAENLKLVLKANDVSGSENLMRELDEIFEFTSFDQHYPHQISGGQRQIASLARALILEPKLLILDEITSALDIGRIEALSSLLMRRVDSESSILMSTHSLGFAKSLESEIFFVERGLIVESGSSKILSRPKSESLRRFLSLESGVELA